MKYTAIFLIIISLALIIGCKEGQATEFLKDQAQKELRELSNEEIIALNEPPSALAGKPTAVERTPSWRQLSKQQQQDYVRQETASRLRNRILIPESLSSLVEQNTIINPLIWYQPNQATASGAEILVSLERKGLTAQGIREQIEDTVSEDIAVSCRPCCSSGPTCGVCCAWIPEESVTGK